MKAQWGARHCQHARRRHLPLRALAVTVCVVLLLCEETMATASSDFPETSVAMIVDAAAEDRLYAQGAPSFVVSVRDPLAPPAHHQGHTHNYARPSLEISRVIVRAFHQLP